MQMVNGEPPDGPKDWIDNPTRFKLKEARYFFDQATAAHNEYVGNTTDENRNLLLFSLGAFFSAARSITYYMRTQYGDKNGFWEWYCPQQTKLKYDDEMRFLNHVRVNFIHLGPQQVTTVREQSIQIGTTLVYAPNHPLKDTQPPDATSTEIQSISPRTVDVIFKADKDTMKKGLKTDMSVLQFCDRQLKKLDGLVSGCEKVLNRPSRDPCTERDSG